MRFSRNQIFGVCGLFAGLIGWGMYEKPPEPGRCPASAGACVNGGAGGSGIETSVWGALSEKSIREHYDAIKRNYIESGQCHLYSNYSPAEQAAFFAWLLKYEIQALSGTNPNLSREGALDNLGFYLGWNSATLQRWKSDRGNVTDLRIRLVREIDRVAGKSDFRQRMQDRVQWHFKQIRVKDCGDFVAFDVFAEAMRSRNAHLSRVSPEKKHLLTILDRSQLISDRRMMVIDLDQDQVLFHSIAGFGDGKIGGDAAPESKKCSNDRGFSPAGPAVTSRTGPSKNGSFRGDGIFLEVPNPGGNWSGSRGLAIHTMSAYSALNLKAEQGGITRHYQQLRGTGANKTALDEFLYAPASPAEVRVPATDGCVGVPDENMEKVKGLLSGGEFVYFHCPRSTF